jgi:transcriptional regulator with XRE-family HTH domain
MTYDELKQYPLSYKIKYLRSERGLTLQELSEKLNVNRNTVWEWEAGVSNPKYTNMISISKFFNVPITILDNKLQTEVNL